MGVTFRTPCSGELSELTAAQVSAVIAHITENLENEAQPRRCGRGSRAPSHSDPAFPAASLCARHPGSSNAVSCLRANNRSPDSRCRLSEAESLAAVQTDVQQMAWRLKP